MISEECSDTVVGLDMLVDLSTGLRCSLKPAIALNHVNRVLRIIGL